MMWFKYRKIGELAAAHPSPPSDPQRVWHMLNLAGDHEHDRSLADITGLVAAIIMGISATMGNLATEVIVKHKTTRTNGREQSVFMQTIVLYAYTSFCALVTWIIQAIYNHDSLNLFNGWDSTTHLLVIMQVSILSVYVGCQPRTQTIHICEMP